MSDAVQPPSDELRAWIDRTAIGDLIARACDAVSRADWDAFEAVWAPDAVWEESAPLQDRLETARGIRDAIAARTATVDVFVQTVHGTVVTLVDDDHATATSNIEGLARVGEQGFRNFGIYHDDVVRTAAGWRFAHRYLQNVYVESAPLVGVTAIARADLR
jgi:ketosteroid isomerase-like protein